MYRTHAAARHRGLFRGSRETGYYGEILKRHLQDNLKITVRAGQVRQRHSMRSALRLSFLQIPWKQCGERPMVESPGHLLDTVSVNGEPQSWMF
jgi:hypothetical protein